MAYVFLGISLAAGVCKSVLSKSVNKADAKLGDLMNVNILIGLLGTVVFLFNNPFTVDGDFFLFLVLAFLLGLLTVGSQTFFMFAVKDGEVSVCSIVYSSNFILPTVFSALVYRDSLTAWKIIGMTLMLIAVVLVSGKGENKATARSVFFAVLAMLCSAGVGIVQKVFAHVYGNGQSTFFLFFAFAFVLLSSLAVKGLAGKSEDLKATDKITENLFLKTVLAVSVILANKLNLYLAGALPATVFFPILNGGTVVLSAVAGAIFYKDKFTVKKTIAIPVSLLAIVVFSL